MLLGAMGARARARVGWQEAALVQMHGVALGTRGAFVRCSFKFKSSLACADVEPGALDPDTQTCLRMKRKRSGEQAAGRALLCGALLQRERTPPAGSPRRRHRQR